MKLTGKVTLLTAALFALSAPAVAAETTQSETTVQPTTAETTTEAPAPVALDREWQAVDFRDTLERTFLYAYKDSDTRLKLTEIFEDVFPTLTINGTNVTYSYTADMNKYFEYFAETHKDKIKDKAEAAKVVAETAKRAFKKTEASSGTYNDETYIFKGKQEKIVLDTNAKTITFPDVPNIFGVIPLYISSTEVPITYHYEVNGLTFTIK